MLYDLVTETVHVLNPSAGLVWEACDGVIDLAQVVSPVVEATGAAWDQVATDVEACVDQLADAGLVARTVDAPEPPPIERTAVDGARTGAVHAVLDDGVCFRGDDGGLLAAIDGLLGDDDGRPVTIELGVREDGGAVRLRGWGPERAYGSREAFLDALPTTLNQIAAASSHCIALHAGCVRAATGEVLLLPAVSGSGKTTLTAALIQAGWDYATDEAVGVRAGSLTAVAYPKPLVLDPSSRAVLGLGPVASPNASPADLRDDVSVLRGDVGPVTRVVLPRYEAGASTVLEMLDPRAAIVGILEHALNLGRVGQPGLDALCQLALTVPVQRLVHGSVESAVGALGWSPS